MRTKSSLLVILMLIVAGIVLFITPAFSQPRIRLTHQTPIATIVEVRNGTATVTRQLGLDNYTMRLQAQPGTTLSLGDLIYPSRGSVVVIQCGASQERMIRNVRGVGEVCPENIQPRFDIRTEYPLSDTIPGLAR